jgi:hypothetical protein
MTPKLCHKCQKPILYPSQMFMCSRYKQFYHPACIQGSWCREMHKPACLVQVTLATQEAK